MKIRFKLLREFNEASSVLDNDKMILAFSLYVDELILPVGTRRILLTPIFNLYTFLKIYIKGCRQKGHTDYSHLAQWPVHTLVVLTDHYASVFVNTSPPP